MIRTSLKGRNLIASVSLGSFIRRHLLSDAGRKSPAATLHHGRPHWRQPSTLRRSGPFSPVRKPARRRLASVASLFPHGDVTICPDSGSKEPPDPLPKRRFMSPSIAGPVLVACALCLSPAAARAQTLKVDYAISLAGIPLGSADLAMTFEGSKYKMQVGAKLTGLAGLLTGGRGAATAAGALSGSQPVPASFAVTSRSSNDQRTVRMGLTGGSVAAVEITPPLDEKPDRVPLKDSHKRGILDPVSALIMPASRASPTDPGNCNRTLPVFDGAA